MNINLDVGHIFSDDIENVLQDVLRENEICFVNYEKIANECHFQVLHNGDTVFYHLSTPLLLIKKMESEFDGDSVNFTMKYAKLYKDKPCTD